MANISDLWRGRVVKEKNTEWQDNPGHVVKFDLEYDGSTVLVCVEFALGGQYLIHPSKLDVE
jgi:hypothetical protein